MPGDDSEEGQDEGEDPVIPEIKPLKLATLPADDGDPSPRDELGSSQPHPDITSTKTSQTLRFRTNQPQSRDLDSYSTARAALFANRRKPQPSSAQPTTETSTATAEAILDHQREEQDAISESILRMARGLKESSNRFASTLEEDKRVLSNAGSSMEKTETGMDAATRRMGALRHMTEGKGWWGRILLFVWVYGLMLGLLVLLFVLPKFRF
jgi:hypothetical protein